MDIRHLDWPPFEDALFEKAKRLAGTTSSAAIASNAITLYAMLVLQNMLAEQACNPNANIEAIILITNSIANLADSINII
ncbi:hypothetical protein AXX12_07450 [Anaerosporomusa subterranea]|uniref:Cyclodeaminase/cyclohydrolase domain-containing protein n=1 Tax=Anaerosporomusa subterranea TaxID=1794912 RepID=A0A154BQQ4_ANASB|nr:hypothetical protein [Anaerosporomusa subterranea]KYZ76266.1 hypothetical protein AXX12_07450 [Anaerosporomusa subterranea]